MEIARLLRDFQEERESPAFGLSRGASFFTALLPTNCAKNPFLQTLTKAGVSAKPII